MLTPFILFLGLTIATAVIAHWSDNLGKKLGKKRVSLFGLRPRTTATILTIASSWGIMLFTLAALLIVFVPLRNALFFYDSERAKAEELKRDVKSAQRGLTDTRKLLTQARTDVQIANSDAQKSRDDAQKAEDEGRKRAAAAQTRAAVAETAANAAQSRVVLAQKRVELAQKRFDAAQKREAAARKGEAAAQRETLGAQRETRAAEQETRAARFFRDEAGADLKKSLDGLRVAQGQLQTARGNLQTVRGNLQKVAQQRNKVTKDYLQAEGNLLTAQKDLSETERQLVTLRKQRDEFEQASSLLAGNDAPIKVGQVFASRAIAANQTPAFIAARLRELVQLAQQSFADSEDISPNFPAGATLQLFRGSEGDASGKSLELSTEEILEFLARQIAATKQANSIRLVAVRNFLPGETRIDVIFKAVPILPAFESGEVLAAATIDGTQGSAKGDARIFSSLLDLIDLGRREAEKRGVNPPQSPNEPSFYAEGTNVLIFEALRRINSSQARVGVTLVTAKALSTVEPLQVRFEIENGASNSPISALTPNLTP